MILKGSQRSGGKQLAAHLLKTEENELVAVHELRGFMSANLPSAFNEVHAISKGFILACGDRLSGKYEKTRRQNEVDALIAFQCDRQQKDELIFKHIQQRQHLSLHQRSEIHTHELEIELLCRDIQDYRNL